MRPVGGILFGAFACRETSTSLDLCMRALPIGNRHSRSRPNHFCPSRRVCPLSPGSSHARARATGHLGDVYGRKKALVLSVTLMSGSTLAIGCLPTYFDIGLLATFLLSLMRLLQGLSVGGEFVGSLIFAIESAPPEHRVFAGSVCTASATAGVTLGSWSGLLLNSVFSADQMRRFAWRLPFLGGVLIGLFALWARTNLEESHPLHAEHARRARGQGAQHRGANHALHNTAVKSAQEGGALAGAGAADADSGAGGGACAGGGRRLHTHGRLDEGFSCPGGRGRAVGTGGARGEGEGGEEGGGGEGGRGGVEGEGYVKVEGEGYVKVAVGRELPLVQAIVKQPKAILVATVATASYSFAVWYLTTFPPVLYHTLMEPPLGGDSDGGGRAWLLHSVCCLILSGFYIVWGWAGQEVGAPNMMTAGRRGPPNSKP
jgi:hypothetical protein